MLFRQSKGYAPSFAKSDTNYLCLSSPFPPAANRRRGIADTEKGAPLLLYSQEALAEALTNTGRRNAPSASLHIGASPQPCRSSNEKPASISCERRVCVNAKSTDAVGGGARRFAAVSSQPMAPTRPPGDGVSRREIVYQNLTRGARHPAPTHHSSPRSAAVSAFLIQQTPTCDAGKISGLPLWSRESGSIPPVALPHADG